jgi:hypothetical protein
VPPTAPATTTERPTAKPTPTVAPTPNSGFSPDEQMLVDIASRYITANEGGVGVAACKSKSKSLPAGATAGIECIGDYAVSVGGYYLYPTAAEARASYVERITQYGVALESGDCASSTAGDSAWWVPEGSDARDSPWRVGCFINENGNLNLRLVCHAGTPSSPSPVLYVGLVGWGGDPLDNLYGWALGPSPGYPFPVPLVCDPHGENW